MLLCTVLENDKMGRRGSSLLKERSRENQVAEHFQEKSVVENGTDINTLVWKELHHQTYDYHPRSLHFQHYSSPWNSLFSWKCMNHYSAMIVTATEAVLFHPQTC